MEQTREIVVVPAPGCDVALRGPASAIRALEARFGAYVRPSGEPARFSGTLAVMPSVQKVSDVPLMVDKVRAQRAGGLRSWARDGGFVAEETAPRVFDVRSVLDGAGPLFQPVLESFFRALVANVLLEELGGALWHAASVDAWGHGILVSGLSGAGKTTFAEGARRATYLNDDQSVMVRDGVYRLAGSPFFGMAGRPGPASFSVPLRAIALLEQTTGNTTVTRLPKRASTVQALSRHVCAFFEDRVEGAALLERLLDLVDHVPVFAVQRNLETSSDALCEQILDACRPNTQ